MTDEYMEGRKAWWDGVLDYENPYDTISQEAEATEWELGWTSAEDEAIGHNINRFKYIRGKYEK